MYDLKSVIVVLLRALAGFSDSPFIRHNAHAGRGYRHSDILSVQAYQDGLRAVEAPMADECVYWLGEHRESVLSMRL